MGGCKTMLSVFSLALQIGKVMDLIVFQQYILDSGLLEANIEAPILNDMERIPVPFNVLCLTLNKGCFVRHLDCPGGVRDRLNHIDRH